MVLNRECEESVQLQEEAFEQELKLITAWSRRKG